ncbi:protein ASC1, putative [Entamoeba dispar SAW760]|uniref:Protein ASC1, putative n=1 Tax=Entamoeba dispar (strain ATCC PRA-260 / SAW760) TaxID=370354 RepID=B0EA08_ENTDS|nr:protein ASC1, putative [Entamoeba dispar SAW760]EDR28621.1 protein ASC1, putative [Entamoeba dispar SAW760]|eukprot:EDR28621.1 protein ASC1, putative [Entamoeba dispar SAW760]
MQIMKQPPQLVTKWDKSFFLQLLMMVPLVVVCFPSSFNRSEEFKQSPLPKPIDLLPSIIPLAVISILRIVLAENLFKKIAKKVVYRKPEWDEKFTQFRYERFGLTFFKFLYYLGVAPFGVYLFRNEDWMPSALFGQGKSDLLLIYENFPYVPEVPYLTMFYCLELGYHLHSLLFHICSTPRNDYYDTLLHHVATIFLVIFSYVNNCGRIGVCVMVLHDIVDAIMYYTKCTNDFKNQVPCYIGFFFLVISYARFRLYVFPRYIIYAAIQAYPFIPKNATGGYIVWGLLVGMLCSLLILHIYWFKLIIEMIFKVASHEGVVDPHAGKQKNEL